MTIEETSNRLPHRTTTDVHGNAMAWVSGEHHDGRGHFERVTGFDYSDVDRHLVKSIAAEPDDVRALAADLFGRVMLWTWQPTTVRASMVRFAAFTAGLRPDLLRDRTYKEIGQELRVSKASLSKAGVLFQRAFGFHFSRCRTDEQCANMAEAQRGHGPYNRGARR